LPPKRRDLSVVRVHNRSLVERKDESVTDPALPFIVLPGEGKTIEGPVGGPAIIKAHTQNTNGSVAAVENVIPPGQGPPLHSHGREDEMWLILEGAFRFRAGSEISMAPAGSFVFVPRGTPHCFQNIGETAGRVMVLFTPSGMERFFELHAQLPPGPPDPAAYNAIAASCSMDVLGPPLALSDPISGS
jgi:mannose-6-phosphate isomerase-like protein (cupin superfamily)